MQRARCHCPSPLGTRASRTFRSELRCIHPACRAEEPRAPPPAPPPRRRASLGSSPVLDSCSVTTAPAVHHRAGGQAGVAGGRRGPEGAGTAASTCPLPVCQGEGQPRAQMPPPGNAETARPQRKRGAVPTSEDPRPQSQAAGRVRGEEAAASTARRPARLR